MAAAAEGGRRRLAACERALRRIWLRLRRLSEAFGLEPAFFRASHRLARWLFGSAAVQRMLSPARVELFDRFLRNTGLDTHHSVTETVRQSLLQQTILAWRYLEPALAGQPVRFDADIVVEHWHRFETAHQSGRGVLFALNHQGLARLFILLMRARGYEGEAVRLRVKARLRRASAAVTDASTLLLGARDLLAAQRALRSGGIAFILPDGRHGKAVAEQPLFGRTRAIMTGFADLALSSGALVLPVATLPDADGRIRVTIYDAFDPGSPGMTDEERIELLASQYAAHLARVWTLSPGSIFVSQIERFLRQPGVRQSDRGAAVERQPAA